MEPPPLAPELAKKFLSYRGVLEPVLVTPKDGKYLLLCGERRYLAALKLELPTIPARILDAITQKDEILAFQLTENLQRVATHGTGLRY